MILSGVPNSLEHAATVQPPANLTLSVHGFSYEDRRTLLPALSDAMAHSGCWLLDRQMLSSTQMELLFEIQLRSALELYSDLISAGLELTKRAHTDLTGLCMLCKHNPRPVKTGRVITIRLQVDFLDEEYEGLDLLSTGSARA